MFLIKGKKARTLKLSERHRQTITINKVNDTEKKKATNK